MPNKYIEEDIEEALKLHLNIVDLDGRSIVLKER